MRTLFYFYFSTGNRDRNWDDGGIFNQLTSFRTTSTHAGSTESLATTVTLEGKLCDVAISKLNKVPAEIPDVDFLCWVAVFSLCFKGFS